MAPQWNNQGGTKLVNYFLFDESPWSFNHHSFISFIFFNHITKNQTQTIIRMTLPFRHDLLQGSFLLANKQLKGEKSQNGEVDIRENEKKNKKNSKGSKRFVNVIKCIDAWWGGYLFWLIAWWIWRPTSVFPCKGISTRTDGHLQEAFPLDLHETIQFLQSSFLSAGRNHQDSRFGPNFLTKTCTQLLILPSISGLESACQAPFHHLLGRVHHFYLSSRNISRQSISFWYRYLVVLVLFQISK